MSSSIQRNFIFSLPPHAPQTFTWLIPQCAPELLSTNYYNQTAPILYAFDEENDNTISNALANSAVNGDNYFNIIVGDSLDFEDAYSTLVQDGYVVNYIESANNMLWGEVELDTSSYAYKNDTLRVITIVLNYIN